MSRSYFPMVSVFLLSLLLFTACTGGGAGGGVVPSTLPPDTSVIVTTGTYEIETLTETGSFSYDYSNNSGESHDLFFIFTNYSSYDASAFPTVNQALSDSRSETVRNDIPQPGDSMLNKAFEEHLIEQINGAVAASLRTGPPLSSLAMNTIEPDLSFSYTEGVSTESFYDDIAQIDVPSTLRKQRTVGGKTLQIWVADDCWEVDGTKTSRLSQNIVDTVADYFLPEGGPGIYSYVTEIYGDEWGDNYDNYSNLIPPDDRIVLFLHDIADDDSTNGGTLGYFSSRHNTTDYDDTDQCIRFSVDAVLLATEDSSPADGWSASDYWPRECISTLAHEFQHVIQFYQKVVTNRAAPADTWINEMASLAAEDFTAEKIGVPGPRGVPASDGTAGSTGNRQGRLPLFNYWSEGPLAPWGTLDSLVSYSTAYSFGSFLARNYGGALLFRDIVQNAYSDEQAIVSAVISQGFPGETFEGLLVKWGIAVLLSDKQDANPGVRYNFGNYLDSAIGSATYRLGSINMFNYSYTDIYGYTQVGPYIYSGSGDIGIYEPYSYSNLYYYARTVGSLSSDSWDISLPEGVRMTVVIK